MWQSKREISRKCNDIIGSAKGSQISGKYWGEVGKGKKADIYLGVRKRGGGGIYFWNETSVCAKNVYMYICIKLFLSLRVIQSIYATRLHRFGNFDWRPQHVPEGLNLWQKVSTYHNYGQCCVISLYRFHSCSKIESVNKILSPDHVIVTRPFCYARK